MSGVASAAPRVGIIGGGQLARMTHQAAIALGIDVTVLCEDPSEPAIKAGARWCEGRPDELADLERLARRVDVVTVDHERTPAALLARLAEQGHVVAPGARAARLGQDKAEARGVLAGHGIATAPWTLTDDLDAIAAFAETHGWPLVLKAPRGGYDGRGVWPAADVHEVRAVLERHPEPVLVEPHLRFDAELSVMVVRSRGGETVAYPAVETVQRDGICTEVLLPAHVPIELAAQARAVAARAALAADLVGAMAVELFVVDGGLLLNELAVRPHNSGHLTIEACATSQFENHLRAVLGLPLGATDATVAAACMVNVLGAPDGSDPFASLGAALEVASAHVHRYAKDPWPGRKVGHITATAPSLTEARRTAHRALSALSPREEVPC